MRKKSNPLLIIFIVLFIGVALYLLASQQFSIISGGQLTSGGYTLRLDNYSLSISVPSSYMMFSGICSGMSGSHVSYNVQCGLVGTTIDSYGCQHWATYQTQAGCNSGGRISGSNCYYGNSRWGNIVYSCTSSRIGDYGGPEMSRVTPTQCEFTGSVSYNGNVIMNIQENKTPQPKSIPTVTSFPTTYFKNGNITTDINNADMAIDYTGNAFEGGVCTYVYTTMNNLKNPCKNITCDSYCSPDFTRFENGTCTVLNDTDYKCDFTKQENASFCMPKIEPQVIVNEPDNNSIEVIHPSDNVVTQATSKQAQNNVNTGLWIFLGVLAIVIAGIFIYRGRKR